MNSESPSIMEMLFRSYVRSMLKLFECLCIESSAPGIFSNGTRRQRFVQEVKMS